MVVYIRLQVVYMICFPCILDEMITILAPPFFCPSVIVIILGYEAQNTHGHSHKHKRPVHGTKEQRG